MKILRLLFLAIVFAVAGNLYGQVTLELDLSNYPKWKEVISECVICGRTLRSYVEDKEPVLYDNMWGYAYDSWSKPSVPPEEIPCKLLFDETNIAPVCSACELRYKNVWLEKYHKLFNELKEQALKEHALERIQWSESRKRNEIKKAKQAIENAKQELYWLEHPEERPKPETYGIGQFSDTISTHSFLRTGMVDSMVVHVVGSDSVKAK